MGVARTIRSANRKAKAVTATKAFLAHTHDGAPTKAELDARLQQYTQRPFATQPPVDTDTMSTLGIGGTDLELLRRYVNRTFDAKIPRDQLKAATTYKELREKCGV